MNTTTDARCPDCQNTGWIDVKTETSSAVRRCHCQKDRDRLKDLEVRKRHLSKRAREQTWAKWDPNRTGLYEVLRTGERRTNYPILRDWMPGAVATEGEGDGLYWFGLPRSGKTHAVNALANGLIEAGVAALVWNVTALVEAEFEAIRENTRKPITDAVRAPVLILDDLGAARPKSWALEYLYRLVNERHENKGATIYVSNLDLPGLERHLSRPIGDAAEVEVGRHHGARVFARIVESSKQVYRFEKRTP
jgi:DNA replication protein DnaC